MNSTAKIIHVEPDEDITDVVERIREHGEGGVVLVVPQGARIAENALNIKLLHQYSSRAGGRAVLVTNDARTANLARDAGFAVYASMDDHERGVEMASTDVFALAQADQDGEELSGVPVVALGKTGDRPSTSMPKGTRVKSIPVGKATNKRKYFAAAALFVVGLLLFVLFVPSAKVTITLAATPLSVNPTIQGSPAPADPPGRADYVVTTAVTADEQSQFQARPSGQQVVPAAAASGTVTFTTTLPFGAQFTIPKNEEFDTQDNPPIRFFAVQDTPITVPSGGQPSSGVAVKDGTPEGRGNVSVGAIRMWPGNPCGAPATPGGQAPCSASDLTITNLQPTSGGTDPKTIVVVSDQDAQGFNTQVDALRKQLTDKVTAEMQQKDNGGVFAQDPSGGGKTINVDTNPPLPKVGDQYQPTVITVAVHGRGAMYKPADLRAVVQHDLNAQLPPGEKLAANPTISDPAVMTASDDGTVVFSESGSGFGQPAADFSGLKDSFTGKSRDQVRQLTFVKLGAAVKKVDVQQPIPMFVLPLFSSRIEVNETVVASSNVT